LRPFQRNNLVASKLGVVHFRRISEDILLVFALFDEVIKYSLQAFAIVVEIFLK
jgi:hypothetical protein